MAEHAQSTQWANDKTDAGAGSDGNGRVIAASRRSRQTNTKSLMRTKQISVTFLMSLLGGLSQSASAAVIINDAVIGPSIFGAGHVFLTLSQSIPSGQGLFAIDIETVDPSQYHFSYAGIAEYYKFFAVAPGASIDPAFVLQNSPIVSNDNNPGSNTQTFALNQSKYFGYWDDRLNGNEPDSNDNYGWVLLTRTSSGLVASSGATAIGGGIIVGTTNQLPEPTSTMLIALGFLSISRRRASRNDRNC